jgi:hypothetical protein
MYKLLRAKRQPRYSVAKIKADSWRQGTVLAAAPTTEVTVTFEREVAPEDFYWGIPPIFDAALLAMLREAGADNLEDFDARLTWPAKVGEPSHARVVNVVGTVSLATFVLDVPPEELARLDARDRETLDGVRDKLAERAASLPRPTAAIARMAEWNKPLLIRADLAAKLPATSNIDFVSVVHAGELTGTDLTTYLDEASDPDMHG